MPLGLGIPELLIILVILIVIFGPKRLPGIGKSLGQGMREFKDSVTGGSNDDEDEPTQLPAAEREPAAPAATTTAPAEPVAAEQDRPGPGA